ncbi:hypothetical protein T310_0096 [Rasamsonia emersonii CBS 393.64]|uniref:G domain-containing protein n=1 Tax=Rasamsonia emersonii (strain ATCC 16479 / CBS 393.64 / IMI 116815) TaxID=1408163 RepID=A0A0F4Z7Q8_RASE3|nr:hypothetical protein T310_0096 [Rasamsonia emersonii CBS 393.64]KKA25893.1 hypothetical protein T310_0096 [Rasamsonia emersonii CBS 393.64]
MSFGSRHMDQFCSHADLTEEQASNFRTVTENCRADLDELLSLVTKDESAAAAAASKNAVRHSRNIFKRVFGRVKLGMVATEDTSGLRARMTMHTVALATLIGIHVSSNPAKRVQFWDSEVLIVILGATGSGKTTFLNAAAGPGFDDTYRPDVDLIMELADYLEVTYRAQFMTSGVVYMQNIAAPRMTGSAVSNLNYLRKLCGMQSFSKIAFVTTFWGTQYDDELGERHEQELKEEFWSEEIRHGAKVRRFFRDAKVVLDIQKELVEEDKPFGGTAVGVAIADSIKDGIGSFQRRQTLVDRGIENAGADDLEWLAEEKRDIKQRIRALEDQLQQLSGGKKRHLQS